MNGDLPYFRVYAAELLADQHTGYYDVDELGSWFRLVCQCWVDRSIPDDPKAIARLLRMPPGERFDRVWEAIKDRFVPADEPGRLTSRRLEQERYEATEARDQKIRAGKAGGAASGEARRKQRSSTASQPAKQAGSTVTKQTKPIQPASQPSSHPSSPASQPTGAVPKASGSDPTGTRPPRGGDWLAGFRKKLGETLQLDGAIAVGNRAEVAGAIFGPDEIASFIEHQVELVGEPALLADCLELAKKCNTGTPSSLAWFVPWLARLPVPQQPGGAS